MFDMKCFVRGSNVLEFLLLVFNICLLLNNIPTYYLSGVVFSEGVDCDLLLQAAWQLWRIIADVNFFKVLTDFTPN